jgi:hypothetical protein
MFLNSQTFRTTDTRFILRAGSREMTETGCDWEARFKYRPRFVRNEIRFQVARKCRFSGESFDRIWANTGRLVGASFFPGSLIRKRPNVTVAQLCANRLTKLRSSAERLSDSYNKLLIQASAEYCMRVLKGVREDLPAHQRLLTEIRKLTSQEQDLLSQFSGYMDELALLNLQVFEDRFMRIQEESERLGVFPRLNSIPIDQLFDR